MPPALIAKEKTLIEIMLCVLKLLWPNLYLPQSIKLRKHLIDCARVDFRLAPPKKPGEDPNGKEADLKTAGRTLAGSNPVLTAASTAECPVCGCSSSGRLLSFILTRLLSISIAFEQMGSS